VFANTVQARLMAKRWTQGIARAHVLARSGNALLSFRLDKFVVNENVQKNHSYCVLQLSGYVVAGRPTKEQWLMDADRRCPSELAVGAVQ